jgi:RNA polymerase sigma-70 factor, ECF subfamily
MNTHVSDSSETLGLLAQAREGNTQAFDRLFARHRPFLRQVVQWRMDRNLHRRIDASDVVQEAHLEAARRLGQYLAGPPMSFKIWLRQITYDRLLMARRRHLDAGKRAVGREHRLPDETSVQLVQRLFAQGPTPSQAVMQGEVAARVRGVLARLTEADREVLVMRHLEGLSNKEIAEALGLEPAAVSKRHGRALLRLRAMLCEDGYSYG